MSNYISKIILPNGTTYDIKDSNISVNATYNTGVSIGTISTASATTTLYAPPAIEIVNGTNTSGSKSLTGNISTPSLTNGQMFIYKVAYEVPTGDIGLTLQLTYSDNTVGTAYPINLFDSVACMTRYPAGSYILLVYNNSAFYVVNPTGAIT